MEKTLNELKTKKFFNENILRMNTGIRNKATNFHFYSSQFCRCYLNNIEKVYLILQLWNVMKHLIWRNLICCLDSQIYPLNLVIKQKMLAYYMTPRLYYANEYLDMSKEIYDPFLMVRISISESQLRTNITIVSSVWRLIYNTIQISFLFSK